MTITDICNLFDIEGELVAVQTEKNGHINDSFKVTFVRHGEEKAYMLQRINSYVFEFPADVMENTINVTEYIRSKIKEYKATAKRDVLHFQKTKQGKYYVIDDIGDYWRCSRFIDDSVTFNENMSLKTLEEAGKAFGEFQVLLKDYDPEALNETISDFHNTIKRFKTLKKANERDLMGRANEVKEAYEEFLKFEEECSILTKMGKKEQLPFRVTHNDTKCNNVLFDKDTNEHLCVIDLDTVMPGLVAYDYGDTIRSGCSTAKEDETNLKKVNADLDKIEAFTKGFLTTVRSTLTKEELDTLYLGPLTVTIECGIRFLTDHLNGDKYFKVAYPGHNYHRALNQLALAKDIYSKLDKIKEMINKY